MKLLNKKTITGFLLITLMLSKSYALEKETHSLINQKIAKETLNIFSLNQYLKNYLGFWKGEEEVINQNEVWKWLSNGGKTEDEPDNRSLKHFHDPLKPWNNAGLYGTFTSSVIWAQNQSNSTLFEGDWSWKKARESFYKGLTNPNKSERDTNLANTFRAIGQVIHLVQDASVPAHTRNDSHVIGYHYESWVLKNYDKLNLTPLSFDTNILNIIPESSAPIPIANIFDANKYNGTNLDIATGFNIGLAEYTNANFFSEDTIFKNYPHPAFSDTNILAINSSNIQQIDAEDGKRDNRVYIKKTVGEVDYRIASIGYFSMDCIKKGYVEYSRPVLDDAVYNDYAGMLIPRAVGYSAGLLNYFFRGTLEISSPSNYVYGLIDGSTTPHQFTAIKTKIRNTTPNEAMQNGILQAVAKYKKRTNYQPDLSTDPPTAESRELEFSYSVSTPVTVASLDSVNATEFEFDFSDSPIPAGITDLYLFVIFQGTLGNEADTAVAIGMKDLNEPQHFTVWNATDRFYLDGVLRTADEIRNNPVLLSKVDHNGDGVADELIGPYAMTTDIAFRPAPSIPETYTATFKDLPPGRYGRIVALTDMPQFYFFVHRISTNPANEATTGFQFGGAVNQESDDAFTGFPVKIFRNIIAHEWTAYANSYPNNTGISTAPWPNAQNINPYPATTVTY